ncbi:SPS1 Sporulation-specific protein 1 [Candida maltosa Xu316]|uniref:non-specific serine/threonine protein kinase n=1 Tax=Candida maltosa (strain Xu316) TaxID=1245528 RepID=M3HHM1_CANMX|nr:hypothetical protein G210_2940 [Candida maltosa Xu316]
MKITKERKQCLDIDPPPSTTNQISKYVLTKCIGRGNFGDVYCAQKTGAKSIVAIKVVNLDDSPDDVKQIIQEIHFLSKLRHNNIVQYIESFTKEYNMYIVMEYCGGGSCSDLLKYHNKLPEDLVAYIIKRVLFGLRYLHSEHKVHRDIKSANVLLTDDGEVKLADFGVSTEITMTKMKKKTFVGTPFWMAPEVITRGRVCEDNNNLKDGNDGGYDEKADIWSTGITTIELVTGSPPLSQYDPLKILFDIPKKRPPLLSGVDFSEDIKDFVRYCLVKDPAKRQSANKLLYHHFLSKSFNNEATRNKLIRYITQKIKSDKQKNGYKPRYKIINDGLNKDKENSETPIEWEFNDTLTQKETIMEPSPLFKHEKLLEESIISSYYDDGTRLVSSDDSMILDNRKEGILIHCLQLVQMRGKDEHTRIEVEKFMEILLQFERENPGLCRAIVEEIEKIICN